jgi:hypothetical protein
MVDAASSKYLIAMLLSTIDETAVIHISAAEVNSQLSQDVH